MTRTRGTARKMASLVPTDMFLIYRGRRPPTTPGGGHFGPAVAGRMTARPVSGRAVPAKALAGLGADRLELRALLGTQDREQLLAGLVEDRFHARLELIVDRLQLPARPVGDVLEDLALRVVEIEAVGQAAHHKTLHPIVRETPPVQPVQAEGGHAEGPGGQPEYEHPQKDQGRARAGHGRSRRAGTLHGSPKRIPGSPAIRESKTASVSTREARSASPGC